MATYPLGSVITLDALVRNVDGDLADATAVVVTVTLPDGTTATPAVTRDSLGTYSAVYIPAAAGRYAVRWVATGANASAFVESFAISPPVVTPPTLATVDDVAALGADPDTITEQMLQQASARFRSEARHLITVSDYAQVLRPTGALVRIPRVPVVEVTAVHEVAADGTAGTVLTGWTFDGIDLINVGGLRTLVLNSNGYGGGTVHVEYSAGFAEIPEDVRWAVAAMVKRAAESGTAGVTQEQVGDYSRSFGGYTASGAFSMSRDEQETAKKYRPRNSGSIPLRLA